MVSRATEIRSIELRAVIAVQAKPAPLFFGADIRHPVYASRPIQNKVGQVKRSALLYIGSPGEHCYTNGLMPLIAILAYATSYVHQTWISHTLPCASHWPKHIVWNDTEVDVFVQTHFPRHHNTFRTIRAGAYKADLFRYMVLYIHGGWYADIDNRPVHFPVIIPTANLVLVRSNDPYDWMIEINFMGAKRGHPVLRYAIEAAVANIAAKTPPAGAHRYFGATGPEVMGHALNKYVGRPSKTPIRPDSQLRDVYIMTGNWSGGFYKHIHVFTSQPCDMSASVRYDKITCC